MVTAFFRGHKIEMLNGEFVYSDTKTPTVNNDRTCGYCGLASTANGHDGCLGELPKIKNACCGHGQKQAAYLQYWNDLIISGEQAAKKIERLKHKRDEPLSKAVTWDV